MADSVETLRVDWRNRFRSERKSDKEKVQSEILAHQEEEGFPKELHEGGSQDVAACGHAASKDLGVHTVEMAPTERLKLRRQIAAAAGKKSTTSLSLFMEAYGLGVVEELSTLATQCWDKIQEVQIVETGERTCRSSDV